MRKPLASRIAFLIFIYCAVFIFLVVLQFSNQGNFSLAAGEMTIRGHYLQTQSPASPLGALEPPAEDINPGIFRFSDNGLQEVTGGIKIYFGGLEFNLSEERGKGLILTGADGETPVNPNYMAASGSIVHFGLPGGTVLVFNSIISEDGSELRINAEFSDDITEVSIPIIPRRSSLVHDSGQLGIMYSGSRYSFAGRGNELENGVITLRRGSTVASYRSRTGQVEFDPADYIIAQAENYEDEIQNWKNSSFAFWNQNASILQNEDDIIAYCVQALERGSYAAALAAIPRDFANSSSHSYRSSVFAGGMTNAYRSFTAVENEKLNFITNLTREKSPDILKEEHILDYLFSRNNTTLANDVLNIAADLTPDMLIADYCPGLLEIYSEIIKWRPLNDNPVDHLSEQILQIISENLTHNPEKNLVFASNSSDIDLVYSMRLGMALIPWAQKNENSEWEAIGKSLVLSALSEAETARDISSNASRGRLYSILNPAEHYPRAVIMTDTGHWAWTAASSIRASTIDGNLNVSVTFPVSSSHYIIIRGVRPFIKLQIHGMDWRTDSQFERYDSSGWIYFQQDQILVLKLRHRTPVENVLIFYREPPPPPPPVVETITEPEEEPVAAPVISPPAYDYNYSYDWRNY